MNRKNDSKPFRYGDLSSPLKGFKSIDEQISLLISRNLLFRDIEAAKAKLRECQYYRLTAYRHPFVSPDNKDRFLDGVYFDDIWRLYVFDRRLRFIVMDAIERIEVSLRSRWAHILAEKYGALAYENQELFDERARRNSAHAIPKKIETSKEPCIRHYVENGQKVPIWSLCEILTYGELLTLFNSIKARKLKNEILKDFDLDEKIASSFFNFLRIARNICAHHGRLWNKRLFANIKIPSRPEPLAMSVNYPDISDSDTEAEKTAKMNAQKSVYNVLVILIFLVGKIAPQSEWKKRLTALISAGEKEGYLKEMGFPQDWKSRPIWK